MKGVKTVVSLSIQKHDMAQLIANNDIKIEYVEELIDEKREYHKKGEAHLLPLHEL